MKGTIQTVIVTALLTLLGFLTNSAMNANSHLDQARRMEKFVEKGERFTAENGFKLSLRVTALEKDFSWNKQIIADAMVAFTTQIERMSDQVDRLEHHNIRGTP
ncbi:MAG: hypothetical protein V3W32_05830 [Gemmatimonadota bacterium]